MVAAAFAISMVTTAFAISVIATAFAVSVVTAAFAISMVTATLCAAMTGATAATALTFLNTTAGRQFGSCSGIRLHVVGIIAQLADLLTQLVGVGSGSIVGDGQFGGLHIVRVVLNALEIRHVLFEFVRTFLADAIGLDGDSLVLLGGRLALLCAHAQRDEAY